MIKQLWKHRMPCFFGMLLVLAFLWEVYSPDPQQDISPVGYADVVVDLFPEDPKSLFYLGLDAMYAKGDLVKAKEYFEAALDKGDKTNEQLFLAYANCLILLNHPDAKIEAVIQKWKKNFPHSKRRDPRELRR